MGDGEVRHMQIGEVAARTELSIRTVRYYDEAGLVTPTMRSAGGFRLYADDAVNRLLVIRRMKPLGFTLAEMKLVLDSLDVLDSVEATTGARQCAAEHLTGFQGKVTESVASLRRKLDYAEGLADLLAAQLSPDPAGV